MMGLWGQVPRKDKDGEVCYNGFEMAASGMLLQHGFCVAAAQLLL